MPFWAAVLRKVNLAVMTCQFKRTLHGNCRSFVRNEWTGPRHPQSTKAEIPITSLTGIAVFGLS